MNIIGKKIQYLKNSKFIHGVAVVAGGATVAQIINFAFSPVITRIFNPETMGLSGVFASVLNILTPIVTMAYVNAIVLPKNDRDAVDLVTLSIRIAIIFSLVLFPITIIFRKLLAEALGHPALSNYFFLIPPLVIIIGIDQVLGEWLVRKKKFKTIGKVEISRALLLNGTKVGIGYFLPTSGTLIILTSLSHVFHAALLYLGAFKSLRNSKDIEINIKKSDVLCKYRDFPLFRAPQVFINTLSLDLPMIMLTSYFDAAVAGNYFIARRIILLPSMIIRTAVNKVFLPFLTEVVHEDGDVRKVMLKSTFYMTLVGIIPFGIFMAFGPQLFSFVFGSEWVTAGQYSQWLALWLFFSFIAGPSGQAIPILSLQRKVLIQTIAVTFLRIAVIILGGLYFQDDLITIKLFSFVGVINNIVLLFLVFSACVKKIRKL